VTLVCASGAHKGNTIDHCIKIAGKQHADRFKIVLHDAQAKDACVHVGSTSFGTEVLINKVVCEASCVIATGVIMPHYYAGFTGGRKSVLPGTACEVSVLQNHSLNFYDTGTGRNPNAYTCNLKGNPVHEDMVEGARMTGVDFIINTTMGWDSKTVTGVFCGDMKEAHEKGCEFYLKRYTSDVDQKYDIVIAAAGGSPKDSSLYQAHKAIDNAFKAVKSGGILVVLARCEEGFGKENFYNCLCAQDIGELEKNLRGEYHVEGHTALCLRMKAEKADIFLVSELDASAVTDIGLVPFTAIDQAIESVLHKHAGQDPSILVIPHADQFILG
jgi:nickel-dependent lactate racemase